MFQFVYLCISVCVCVCVCACMMNVCACVCMCVCVCVRVEGKEWTERLWCMEAVQPNCTQMSFTFNLRLICFIEKIGRKKSIYPDIFKKSQKDAKTWRLRVQVFTSLTLGGHLLTITEKFLLPGLRIESFNISVE